VPCCSQAAISAFSQLASTTRPSTPAVRRPALSSVTRRTLISALLRDRSISFCRLRTLFRSPAFDAAKIRCRSRRTFSSAWPQSTWSQSGKSPSGPFTSAAPVAVAPALAVIGVQLALRFRRYGVRCPAGSPDPRQRPFRPGQLPLSGQLSGNHWRRSQHLVPGFLLPFGRRPSLPGSSCARRGIPPPSRSAYRPRHLPDPVGVITFRMHEIRPGWVSSKPRGRWCAPGQQRPPGRHLPPSSGRPLSLAAASHRRECIMTRRHRGFTHVHPSGLPQPVTPGWDGSPWAFPRASHPAVTLRCPEASGQSNAHWTGNYVTDISRPSFVP
jgi:hypothetical protein